MPAGLRITGPVCAHGLLQVSASIGDGGPGSEVVARLSVWVGLLLVWVRRRSGRRTNPGSAAAAGESHQG